MRLIIGWTMIIVGYLGMTVHLLVTVSWLWYLLRQKKQPFGSWLRSVYT